MTSKSREEGRGNGQRLRPIREFLESPAMLSVVGRNRRRFEWADRCLRESLGSSSPSIVREFGIGKDVAPSRLPAIPVDDAHGVFASSITVWRWVGIFHGLLKPMDAETAVFVPGYVSPTPSPPPSPISSNENGTVRGVQARGVIGGRHGGGFGTCTGPWWFWALSGVGLVVFVGLITTQIGLHDDGGDGGGGVGSVKVVPPPPQNSPTSSPSSSTLPSPTSSSIPSTSATPQSTPTSKPTPTPAPSPSSPAPGSWLWGATSWSGMWRREFVQELEALMEETLEDITKVRPLDSGKETALVLLRPQKSGSKSVLSVLEIAGQQRWPSCKPGSPEYWTQSNAPPPVTSAFASKANSAKCSFPYPIAKFPTSLGGIGGVQDAFRIGKEWFPAAADISKWESFGRGGLHIAQCSALPPLVGGFAGGETKPLDVFVNKAMRCPVWFMSHTHIVDELWLLGLKQARVNALHDTRILVSLRHPVSRVVSEAKHRVMRKQFAKASRCWGTTMIQPMISIAKGPARITTVNGEHHMSAAGLDQVVAEMIDNPHYAFGARNRQTKMLSGQLVSLDGEDSPILPSTNLPDPQTIVSNHPGSAWNETALRIAVQVLARADAIVLIERLAESWAVLLHRWDWVPVFSSAKHEEVRKESAQDGAVLDSILQLSKKEPAPASMNNARAQNFQGASRAKSLPFSSLLTMGRLLATKLVNLGPADTIHIDPDPNASPPQTPNLQDPSLPSFASLAAFPSTEAQKRVLERNKADVLLWELANKLLDKRIAIAKQLHPED